MTIRQRIAEIQRTLRDTSPPASIIRESDVTLTALLGNVNDELRAADAAYKVVLLACLSGEEAANRAKIRAEVSPEYHRLREAKDTRELVIEMIRSCRAYLRSVQEEMKLER